MPRCVAALALIAALALSGCRSAPTIDAAAPWPTEGAYAYAWKDPLVATVLGTPERQQAPLPEPVPTEVRRSDYQVGPAVPDVLWYEDGLQYALTAQQGPAPLVFLISGTGGGALSRFNLSLIRIFYAAGFHVMAVPSPTRTNFIVNASSTGVVGRVTVDAPDLHRLMGALLDEVREEIDVEGVSLAGYSLGAWHAAFVAHLDEELARGTVGQRGWRDRRGAFDFERVVLINPPVSLYRSMEILDAMLETNLPGGVLGVPAFVEEVFGALGTLYAKEGEFADYGGDFLQAAYAKLRPQRQTLAALIGLAFRLSANDLAFAADVIRGGGYIVPEGARPDWVDPLTGYFASGIRRGFGEYLDGLLLPFYVEREPWLTRERLVENASLERISDYLARARHIRLITNADDIIYAPGDLAFLARTFGDRANVFPEGGHCGNLEYPHTAAAIAGALRDVRP
jgi:pimeloyl-ACP methyl ester carboxylesterase